jgi:hypothetical protein
VRLVYDAGALIAAERRAPSMLALHRRALRAPARAPVVPTIVLGQVWRGTARQAPLSMLLAGCEVSVLDEITAHQGGQLCGHAGTADLADAVVVVLARRLDAGVVTSDPDDIGRLAETWRLRLPVFVV